MIQQLLHLSIPFAIVFSNDILGSDQFIVILARDFERCGAKLTGFYEADLRGTKWRTLESAELRAFQRLKSEGAWRDIPLGAHGRAYELAAGESFQEHYHRTYPRNRPKAIESATI